MLLVKSVITVPGLTGDASWVQLGVAALRFTGAKDVLSLGGGGRGDKGMMMMMMMMMMMSSSMIHQYSS